VPEWVKDRSDDDIPPERHKTPKVDQAADDVAALIDSDAVLPEQGSHTPWVRPFVPGHPATKTTVSPDFTCSLNIVATRQQWVARYGGEDEKDLPSKYQIKKFSNKTRSESYIKNGSNHHKAFRTVLLWLWQKHGLRKREQTIPAHVIKALAPRVGATLKPCPECRAGTCTFMEKGVQALAAAAAAAEAAAAEHEVVVLRSPAPLAYCTFCGGGQHSGGCPLFEQLTMALRWRRMRSKLWVFNLAWSVVTQLQSQGAIVLSSGCSVMEIVCSMPWELAAFSFSCVRTLRCSKALSCIRPSKTACDTEGHAEHHT